MKSTIYHKLFHIFHNIGHEIVGIENIPVGGALLVLYHGNVSIDFFYFHSHMILHQNRLIKGVGDRILFKIPGIHINK